MMDLKRHLPFAYPSDIGAQESYYDIRLDSLSDEALRAKFVKSSSDEETEAFLQRCGQAGFCSTGVSKLLAGILVTFGCTRTSANGVVCRAEMFVLSQQQLLRLLAASGHPPIGQDATFLDIGAGDGAATSTAARALKIPARRVFASEVSWSMRFRLRLKGFSPIADLQDAALAASYDVVACLNVIDRVDDPSALLEMLYQRVKPEGVLVLAVVLPFCASVERLGRYETAPTKPLLAMNGACCRDKATLEASLDRFATRVLPKAGFEVMCFTRVPYLCRGDLAVSCYALSDVVFLLKRLPTRLAAVAEK
ncbi:unnamed protein product [Polarella glacialis]|uniref:DREV methyltransferase n=1 Tax=Polarella glacialis TaxID=89957 RepID=A0A813DT59_POLGL|nr:unnamed protein product [Polarella glacialis]CAE8730294.1 unnamed protein product [Polarella glacialis]